MCFHILVKWLDGTAADASGASESLADEGNEDWDGEIEGQCPISFKRWKTIVSYIA